MPWLFGWIDEPYKQRPLFSVVHVYTRPLLIEREQAREARGKINDVQHNACPLGGVNVKEVPGDPVWTWSSGLEPTAGKGGIGEVLQQWGGGFGWWMFALQLETGEWVPQTLPQCAFDAHSALPSFAVLAMPTDGTARTCEVEFGWVGEGGGGLFFWLVRPGLRPH